MKRFALILSYTDSESMCIRPVQAVMDFLQTPQAGAWSGSEIMSLECPSKESLSFILRRFTDYDFLLVWCFTTNGWIRDDSKILINNNGQLVPTSFLERHAGRQINIYDSLTGMEKDYAFNEGTDDDPQEYDFEDFSSQKDTFFRKRFDDAVMSGEPFQYSLFSCAKGKANARTNRYVPVYTQSLIDAVSEQSEYGAESPLSISRIHKTAAFNTALATCGEQRAEFREYTNADINSARAVM